MNVLCNLSSLLFSLIYLTKLSKATYLTELEGVRGA